MNLDLLNEFIDKFTESLNKVSQVRRNFDYGEGLYSNLDKYKSVGDFIRKRIKKRKKDIENILNSRPDRYKAKSKS